MNAYVATRNTDLPVATHPFQVGQRVFATLEEAREAARYASTIYVNLVVAVIERHPHRHVAAYARNTLIR